MKTTLLKPILGINSLIRRWVFDHPLGSKRRHVVVCGDSHVEVFRHIRRHDLAKGFRFDLLKVNGATAQGMINPNSKTNALEQFRQRIAAMKPHQEIFFQLGEVDCGFVIWHYAEKKSAPLEDQFRRSLDNYRTIIEWALERKTAGITLLSAPPPTITDGQTWGEIANARKGIKASQVERTELTLRYNRELEAMASELGLGFLDITSPLLDPETGLVDDRFMNEDRLDHHLDSAGYSRVIVAALENPISAAEQAGTP